ncbi:MAG: nuclear transport factor 2 family protein, partial [Rhodothermia bacterium]
SRNSCPMCGKSVIPSTSAEDPATDEARATPEFYMLADGARLEYDDVVAGSREFLPDLVVFAADWTDVRITPLDPNHAIASFQFRDSIVTSTGELIQTQGPTTLVWEKRDGEWRAVYADADHYPVDPGPADQ